jgi:transcriptional regulator with XRE-family HTH domain
MEPADLISWRKKNQYTQKRLAQALGVAEMTIYRWENTMRGIPTFLHLALRCLELEGGEVKRSRGMNAKTRKEVKRYGHDL